METELNGSRPLSTGVRKANDGLTRHSSSAATALLAGLKRTIDWPIRAAVRQPSRKAPLQIADDDANCSGMRVRLRSGVVVVMVVASIIEVEKV